MDLAVNQGLIEIRDLEFNLVDGVVIVTSDPIPSESRFASAATFKRGDSFPFNLDRVQVALIAASDLLPIR